MENNNTLSNERIQAEELHRQILINANMAYSSWVEACKCLKKMRDTKLYTQLGFEKFEDYTQGALNIKERQAYTYIKTLEDLGEAFLQSNAEVGITKLSLLVNLPPDTREQIAQDYDLSGLSTDEVKRLVKENDEKGQQIDLLGGELNEANAKIASLEKEVKELESRPIEVAVQEVDQNALDKYKAEIEKQMQKQTDAIKKNADKQVKSAKAEAAKLIEDEKKKAADNASAEAEKKINEYKQQLDKISEEKAQAIQRAEKLEREQQVNASPNTLKFTFYFDELKGAYEKLFECLGDIEKESSDTANKFKAAMKKFQEIIAERLSN